MGELSEQGRALVEHVKERFKTMETNRRPLEEDWLLAYDAFRGQYSNTSMQKWRALEGSQWRSKVFVKVTRMKVVSTVAELNDVLFQGGQLPFSLDVPAVPKEKMILPMDELRERLENMDKKIRENFVQAKYDRVQMMANLELSIYGMNCLKAPVTRNSTKLRYNYEVPLLGKHAKLLLPDSVVRKFGRHVAEVVDSLVPRVECPSIWNVYWDRECVDPQDGPIVHRVPVSPAMLKKMAKDRKLWDKAAVQRAIEKAGQSEATTGGVRPGLNELPKRERNIQLIEYWGPVENKYLKGSPAEVGDGRDYNETEVLLVIADDELVVNPIVNPNPDFSNPFHFGFYERIPHESRGVGIPENMRDAQMMINSSIRCFIDNKAFSGNVLSAVKKDALDPGSDLSVYPGKTFELSAMVQRVDDAITFFAPTDVGRGLLDLYRLFDEVADEESGRPKMSQGIGSKQDPKTAYGMSRLMENSNRQMGNVVRNIDEGNIEPSVESFYHYFMLTDPDESLKGNYTVQAKGFTTYENRVTKGQNLMNLLNLGLSNPMLTRLLQLNKCVSHITKMWNLDPDELLKSDEQVSRELALLAQAAALNAAGAGAPNGAGMDPMMSAEPPAQMQ